jgi:Tfp pilus assembly protein PilN
MASRKLTHVSVLGRNDTQTLSILSRLLDVSVTAGDPWANIDDPHGYQQQKLEGSPSNFAVAIGLAQAALTREPGINLLPQHVTDSRKQQRKTTITISALVLATLLLAPLTLLNRQALHAQQEQLAEYTFQAQRVLPAKDMPRQEGLRVAQQAITALQQPASTPVELLYQLSEKLPDGIMLTNFTFDRGRVAVLKGQAVSNTVLASSLQTINEMAIIDRAMLDYSNQLMDATKYHYDFQITCTLPTTTDPTSMSKRKGTNAKSQTGTTLAQ